MTFFWRIFCTIFFVASLLVGTACVLGYIAAKEHLTDQWRHDYQVIAETLGDTLHQLEVSTDISMKNAVNVLYEIDKEHGLPDDLSLKELTHRTNVSHFYITNSTGRFIRATNGSQETLKQNLFDFAYEYRTLLSGDLAVAQTPMIPSTPLLTPSKYIMIPNHDKTRVLEAGLDLGYLADTFQNVLANDSYILELGLYTPTGALLGFLSKATGIERPDALNLEKASPFNINFSEKVMTLITPVLASVDNCPECVNKGISNDGPYHYLLKTKISLTALIHHISQLYYQVIGLSIAGVILSLFLAYYLAHRLVAKLSVMRNGVRHVMNTGDLTYRFSLCGHDEISELADSFNKMVEKLSLTQDQLLDSERNRALVQCAKQVAHDIRSPLTALKMISNRLPELSEDKRVMIRNAVQRIDDIANDLADRKRSDANTSISHEKEPLDLQLLSSLIETLISEKRTQFRMNLSIEIQSKVDAAAYGLFGYIQPIEFKRVLSNIINNSVESLNHTGEVSVTLFSRAEKIIIEVADNGCGIPEEIIPKLLKQGATFGKEKGSGLGLFHACKTIESWQGTLSLSSTVGKGTVVSIALPQAPTPKWFVPEIHLQSDSSIVIIDDDNSIHQVWEDRFAKLELPKHGISVNHFSSGEAVIKWYYQNPPISKVLFLCDHELLGEQKSGLDLIAELGISKHSILVTSRYEEIDIRSKCANFGIRLIPKGLAGFVPIYIES